MTDVIGFDNTVQNPTMWSKYTFNLLKYKQISICICLWNQVSVKTIKAWVALTLFYYLEFLET